MLVFEAWCTSKEVCEFWDCETVLQEEECIMRVEFFRRFAMRFRSFSFSPITPSIASSSTGAPSNVSVLGLMTLIVGAFS